MARPIPFDPPKFDERYELMRKLERAPAQHAAALLDAYKLLQAMHDRGAIDLARGFLGSADAVLQTAVEQAEKPETTRAMRNLILLFTILGSIPPETLKKVLEPIGPAVHSDASSSHPPGLFRLLKGSFFNRDFRRGLAVMNAMLRGIGAALIETKPTEGEKE